MTDRPILFSGPMVKALLEGRKTMTRRVIKGAPGGPDWYCDCCGDGLRFVAKEGTPSMPCKEPYALGDLLWVREAWRTTCNLDTIKPRHLDAGHLCKVTYEADPESRNPLWAFGRLRPGMFMPRWASRLTLEVTDVKVERLQSISAEDAVAEGIIRQDPTPEDLDWHKGYAEEHGFDPAEDPMQPVWLAPGTRQGWGLTKEQRDKPQWGPTPEFAFRYLWDAINGEKPGHTWADNPWVVVPTFIVHQSNIDDYMQARAA